jgi:hypothetical protein
LGRTALDGAKKKNFAQVLMIANGYPPAYVRVAKWLASHETSQEASSKAICVLTFRTPEKAIHMPAYAKSPYFLPGWWPNIMGMVIDDKTSWQNIDRHINASYRALAPQKLINLLSNEKKPVKSRP